MPPPQTLPRRAAWPAAAAGKLAQQGAVATLDASSGALSKIIAAGRTSGILQLSARGLTEVPAGVYDPEAGAAAGGGAWWEVAELTKLDLSRNEIQQLPAELFGPMCSALTSLDISQNKIRETPPGLEQLAGLKSLAVSSNPLGLVSSSSSTAPPIRAGGIRSAGGSFNARSSSGRFGAATAVEAPADVAGRGLPEAAAQLPNLVSLACAHCGLERLPEALGDARGQPQLSQLIASGNRLTRLPLGMAGASALVKLELQGNCLTELDGRMVAGWAFLAELDVSDNGLQALPDELGRLSRLRMLRVRSNRLAALPAALAACSALVELHAGFNAIAALPEGLGALRGLAVLELRNNLLTEFPAALCGLPLTLLDLTANSLRSLPPELGLMTTLRSVPLDGNPLKLVRRELWAGPVSALLEFLRTRLPDPAALPPDGPAVPQPAAPLRTTSLGGGGSGRELSLRARGLTALPAELMDEGSAGALVKLDLGANPQLGPALAGTGAGGGGLPGMERLRHLSLAACGVAGWPLPQREGGMPLLQTLDLRGNPLALLPASGLSCCPDLRTLDLSGTPPATLAALPPAFLPAAPRLEALVLSGCRLEAAPWEALRRAAGSLKRLDLSGNSLTALPASVAVFTRLEELDVTNNSLAALPPELGLLAPGRGGALRALLLQGNCIRAVRRQLLEGGTGALLDYLASRLPQ